MAVMIEYNGNWKYFSWDNDGYKAKYMGKNANTKNYKCVKGTAVYEKINSRFKRKKKGKKYEKYIYINGDFAKSYNYMKKVKEGKSYKKYSLTGRNCAWMAIQVLKNKYNQRTPMYEKLNSMQYKKGKLKTIIPNKALGELACIYGVKIRAVK